MRGIPVDSKVPAALQYLQRAALVPSPPAASIGPYIARVIAAAGDRIKTMGDILQFREFFVADDELPLAGADFDKLVKAPGAAALLREFAARLESIAAFEPSVLEQELKAFVAERNLKMGELVHPLRFAVTGRTVGLGLYDALVILGRERSLARIRRAASAAG
jgi:glutamyl-tRNA synthetase